MVDELNIAEPVLSEANISEMKSSFVEPNEFQKQLKIDLSQVFFNQSEFAIPYRLYLDNGKIIYDGYGHFSEPTEIISMGTANILTTKPQLLINSEELPFKIAKKDRIALNGRNAIVENQPGDGVGTIRLVLKWV